MNKETIQAMIEQGLPGAKAAVVGDDGQHFQATVTCPGFKGKTMLAMHRMVYETLGDKMGNEIHALSLRTRAF
ncbi:MAG: acid stress-induced BolA-like protein IbaG/YrbA [Gammaproteobacteria bacterium]|jgi:acid stress-induced BolA-like protein IbaG/YrbA